MKPKLFYILTTVAVLALVGCSTSPSPTPTPVPPATATSAPPPTSAPKVEETPPLTSVEPTSPPVEPTPLPGDPFEFVSQDSLFAFMEDLTAIQPYSGWRNSGTEGEAEAMDYVAERLGDRRDRRRHQLGARITEQMGRFHSHFRRSTPPRGTNHLILQTEGSPGVYLGTTISALPREPGTWREGDFRFFIDGDDDQPTTASFRSGRGILRINHALPPIEAPRARRPRACAPPAARRSTCP